jgi:hypothetical protein
VLRRAEYGDYDVVANNVFSNPGRSGQYISQCDWEILVINYTRARDNYLRILKRVRREHDEMVRLGLLPADDGKLEP